MKKQTLLPFIVLALFLCTMVNFIDRVNISVVAPIMIKEYEWDTASLGIVFSSFFWGYLLLQIPFGWLADKYGARRVLGGGGTIWAICTFLTPFSSNIGVISVIRAILGGGEAAIFPSQTAFIGQHLPRKLVSRIQAFNFSASALGPLIATPLCVFCLTHWGWRSVFYIFAVVTLVWVGWWMWITEKAGTTDEGIVGKDSDRNNKTDQGEVLFAKPFGKLEVWGSSMAWYSNSYVFYFFLMWLPTYFVKARGMSLEEMAGFASFPWFSLFCFMNIAGYVADLVKKKCVHHIFWRRMMYAGAFVWSSFFLFQLQDVQSSTAAALLMSAALAGQAFTWPVAFSLPIEYCPKKAGILTGFVNGWGQIAGVLGPIITGYVVLGGQWNRAFLVTAAFALMGAALVAFTSRYSTGVKSGSNMKVGIISAK